ncbi:MAG: TolC family protein [Bacteroidota bacterium]|nr:TolC family protein [Bacteroidota bacterium]
MRQVLLLVCTVVATYAQTAGDTPTMYTLDACIAHALRDNPLLQREQKNIEIGQSALTRAFGQYLPSISATAGYSRQLNIEGGRAVNIGGQVFVLGPPEPNAYSFNAVASYTVFNGFAREATYSQARHELAAASQSFERTRQQVILQVITQYLEVLRALQTVRVRRENLELGRQEMARVRALYEAGRVPITAVYTQEADLGTRELDLLAAENALAQAKAALLATMGVSPDQNAEFAETSVPATVTDSDVADFRKEIGSPAAVVATALRQRSDYAALDARVRAADEAIAVAQAAFMPQLNLASGWSWSNTRVGDFDLFGRYFVSMSVQVPIFDNFGAATQRQQAALQMEQRLLERRQLELQIRTEVRQALLELDAAEKQLDITARALRAAEQSYAAAAERFRVGAGTQLEYLAASNQFVTARINRITAVYGYRAAQARVRFAMGTLEKR